MKNFSGITDNLDITTKKYVDDGLAGKANLAGNNTFKGKQTLIDAPEDGYSIDASGYIKGSWLQSDVKSNYGSGTGMVCVFDGRGWIYYRTPAEILAEAGGAKASDIPPAVTESTVSGWGFTKNTGTVTDVKMNGTSKVTNGVADLGTVLTDAGGTFTGAVSSKSYYKSENADLRTSTTLSHIAVKVDNGRTNSHTAYMNGQINIKSASSSSEKTITIPDKAGTIALTSDIHDGTLTIQKNGETVGTFTANQSSSVTANITVPIKVSELTNDSEFITANDAVKRVVDYNDTSKNIKIGYSGAGISGGDIQYIAGYTVSDGTAGNVARIKDISKDALKSWLGYATVATSGSYNDLSNKPTPAIKSATLNSSTKTLYLTLSNS